MRAGKSVKMEDGG